VSRAVRVPDTVYNVAEELTEERDCSMKEAIRYMRKAEGFDV